jgi:hypothetical protein
MPTDIKRAYTPRVPGRPRGIWVASLGLALAAVGALAIGVLLTFVSGLTPPTDPLFAMLGLAVAACLVVAAVGMWTRRLRRAVVLALAGTAPLACLLGVGESTDFEALTIIAVLGWAALVLVLHRPAPAAWMAGDQPARTVQ